MSILVGRDDELAKCADAPAVLISGEPGIGKSRLATELADRARTTQVVAWGRAWEGEGTPPYWPWLEVLRVLDAEPRSHDAVDDARSRSPELAALLAGDPLSPEPQARFRLLDAIASLVRAVGACVVIDDLHAADLASLELFVFVARSLGGTARLIGTTRDAAFIEDAATALIAKAARETLSVPLRRLTREEVVRWIGDVAPSLQERAGQLFENSDGNPLFVRELIVAWKAGKQSDRPFAIDDAIGAHLGLLSPAARTAVDAASVFGRVAPRAGLGQLGVTQEAIEAAVESGVLVGDGDQVRFGHVLLRDAVYRALSPDERVRLHVLLADTFAADAERAVPHLLAVAGTAPPARLVATVVAAMRSAAGRLAFSDAAALGHRALLVASPALGRIDEAVLRIAIGEAQIADGQGDAGRTHCQRAAAIADAAGEHELFARAAIAHASELRIGRHEESIALLRRAAELPVGDPRLHIQVLARLVGAIIPPLPSERDEPIRLAREALAQSRQLGDDATLCTTLCMMLSTFPHEFALNERLALAREALALAHHTKQLVRAVGLVGWAVGACLEQGDLAATREQARSGMGWIATLPAAHHWRTELLEAMLAMLDGDFERATWIARAAMGSTSFEGSHHGAIFLMVLPYLTGDRVAFAADEAAIVRALLPTPGSRIFISIADALAGRTQRVREAIEMALSLDLSAVPGAAQLGWPVVAAGLADLAPPFYELASAAAERSPLLFGPNALATFGPAHLLAARLADLLGKPERAAEHMAKARAFVEQLGAPAFTHQLAQYQSGGTRTAVAPQPVGATEVLQLERRGELWSMRALGRDLLLEDRRGLAYLALLVAAPHRDIHALELAGIDDAGDAGPLLDDRAKRAYRERAESLRDQLAEAERNADLGRAERARDELEVLANELVRATGLGGRDRRAGSAAERARINVQRRLRDVVRVVALKDAELGRHLELSLKTGLFCRYAPTWEQSFRAAERR